MKDYCRTALAYCRRVVSGKQVACEFVKLACQRQIDDLARWKGTKSPYVFDRKKANRVCALCEYFRHIKGPLAGERIVLEPWQVFILTTVFGWVDQHGNRRFRQVYVEVPRGNGKSALSSAVALIMLMADGEKGAEEYSLATTADQARIVFDVSKAMARKSPDLLERVGARVGAHAITVESESSVFKPLASDSSSLDGLNIHFACVDELHAHKTRDLYDVVETALGKRLQPLLWTITTAGFDTTGICYEVRSDVIDILKGAEGGNSIFGVIYTIDAADDWTDIKAAEKANPNWGVSVQPKTIADHLAKALRQPAAANNYKTKYLDVWCAARSPWMDMEQWDRCADESLSIEDFEGQECYLAVDLASKDDLAVVVLLFPMQLPDGRDGFAAFGRYYLPGAALGESLDGAPARRPKNASYIGWKEEGLITATEGAMLDQKAVEDDIREFLSRFEVKALAFDPWQAAHMIRSLADDGAPVVEVKQRVQYMSEPMKWCRALIEDGRLRHNGDPVLRWGISNVVCKEDANSNIYPRKEQADKKIDPAVALIMALGRTLGMDKASRDRGSMSDFLENMVVV